MNMKKLIQKMTDIENGKQMLNESVVDECGGSMPTAPQQQGNPVTVSVNFNASGAENVMELLNLLKNSGLQASEGPSMPSQGMRMDMENFRNIVDSGDDENEIDVKFDMDKEKGIKGMSKAESAAWDNEPNEIYTDHNTMTKDLSGGLNRQKKAYAKAQDGDNAMAVKEAMDPNAVAGQIRAMAKQVETNPDERAHQQFAAQVESELIDLFQYYQQNMETKKAEAVRGLIRQNKAAQRTPDRRNANNIVEVLYTLMRSNESQTFESLKSRLLRALEEKKKIDRNGDGKNDWEDVKLARKAASAKAAGKDKQDDKKKVSEARKTIYHSWEEVPTPLPNKKAYAVDKASEKKKPVSVKQAPWDKKKEETKEASTDYSAKKARAGKDIGKPGKQFSKIASDAAKRYGSEEKGKKVAGAVLAKLRKK